MTIQKKHAGSTMKKATLPLLIYALLQGVAVNAGAKAAGPAQAQAAIPQAFGVFQEPLVALNAPAAQIDAALAKAVAAYQAAGGAMHTAPLDAWLASHPDSAWAASVSLNIGLASRHGGDYAAARAAFQRTLSLTAAMQAQRDRAVGERAIAELLDLESRLGHADAVAELLQAPQASWGGQAAGAASRAEADLAAMRQDPENILRCALISLSWMIADQDPHSPVIARLMQERAGKDGIALNRLEDIARRDGFAANAVQRRAGEPIPVPSVVHWREGHYAAILGMKDGQYRVRDTASEHEMLMSQDVIDKQSSGYFLAPARSGGAMPWRRAAADDAARIIGSGPTTATNPHQVGDQGISKGNDSCGCKTPPKHGMPAYSVSEVLVSLKIEDEPVSYQPAFGPGGSFTVTYNQLESDQPSTFAFSNLSAQWTHNWVSYVQDDPKNVGSSVSVYMPAGGAIVYTNYNASTGTFARETLAQGLLALVADAQGTHYERRMGDGSVWVFSVSDGATTFPRRYFLTKMIDPQGNAATLSYDNTHRLVGVTDAQGQTMTFNYNNADPLKLTSVTDPFGRTATIGYDAAGRLNSLTDAVGMQTTFAYDGGTNILSMTRPYGTTSFSTYQNQRDRAITITDPLGLQEKFEFLDLAPGVPYSESTIPQGGLLENQYLNYRNVFYWDRNAMAQAPNDYTQAHVTHFMHDDYSIPGAASGVIESEKYPLDSRIWYNYPGQWVGNVDTGFDKPSYIGRVLGNGDSQRTNLTYNVVGNITSRTDVARLQTIYNYDDNMVDLLQVTKTSPAGSQATVANFTYNSQHLPSTYTDAAGLTTTYAYNTAGQILSATDSQNRVTTYTYDNAGHLLSVKRPDGSYAARYTYDNAGRIATYTNPLSYVLTYGYDNLDRLLSVSYMDGTSESWTFDKLDVSSYTDRAGHKTTYTHDALRNLTSRIDAMGHTTGYTYYPGMQLQTETDPNGNTRTWTRDLQGRLTAYQDSGLSTPQTFSYDGAGRLVGITNPDNSSLTKTLDDGNRLVALTDSLGNKMAYTVNLNGNVTQTSAATSTGQTVLSHSWTYDNIYRLLTDVGAQGQTTAKTYDIYSNVGSETDPQGRVTTNTYDLLNRLASVTQPSPGLGLPQPVTQYAYNDLGQVKQVIDPKGLTTSYGYDGLGNLTTQTSPDTGVTSKTYNVNNKLATSTDAKQQTTQYAYDILNRLTSITYADNSVVTYTYDQGSNGIGRLSQISDNGGSIGFAYDTGGRIVSDTRTLTSAGTTLATAYAYDGAGRLASITYPSGRVISYARDADGRISQITSLWNGVTNVLASQVQYRPFGGVISYINLAGVVVNRAYDLDGRVALYTMNGIPHTLSYDLLSNIISATDGGNPANNATYTYDPLSRLTGAQTATTGLGYGYDANGNRTTASSGTASTTYGIAPTSNQLQQITGGQTLVYTIDANGSTTNNGVNQFVYDARGRMSSAVTSAGTVQYTINALGQRVQKASAGNNVLFEYDLNGKLIGEINTTGSTVSKKDYIYLGDTPIAVIQM